MKLNVILLALITAIGAVSAKDFYKCTEEKDPRKFECKQMGIFDINRAHHPLGWPDKREELHTKNAGKCVQECWTRFNGDTTTFLGGCWSFGFRPKTKGHAANCVLFNETMDGLLGVSPPSPYTAAGAFDLDWKNWVYNDMVACYDCNRR